MLYIALPIMNEPQTADFVQTLANQTVLPAGVFVCVNNPVDAALEIREANTSVLQQLQELQVLQELPFPLYILDHIGVDEKHVGVGWARKWALDAINDIAKPEDIMLWMDADTTYPNNYLEEVSRAFASDSKALGLSVPYYHSVDNINSNHQQTVLHYEVYMRSYLINIHRSGIPYTFTAIGSGIASTVKAYRKIGGITPVKSGEDFYFIQKLWKTGKVMTYCNTICYPSARASNRVFFGTGPAIIKGLNNDWKSYPIYPFSLFEKLKRIYDSFEILWDYQGNGNCNNGESIDCVFDQSTLNKFRANAATREQFVKFCTEKFDALRILQYLKSHYIQDDITDMENLHELLAWCGTSYENLSQSREVLFKKENELRAELNKMKKNTIFAGNNKINLV